MRMSLLFAALALVVGSVAASAQLSTPVSMAGYLPCALENGYCDFGGVNAVAFGGGTPGGISFQFRFLTNGTSCSDSLFGDPLPGVTKSCYRKPLVPCAAESEVCSFSGSAIVVYGVGTSFTTGVYTGSVPCGNSVFGDPAVGVLKRCYLLQ